MELDSSSQHGKACDRLIVALDSPSQARAMHVVERLEGRCVWFKVGLELYLAAGPSVVEVLRAKGLKVFLDLKLHDIPNTVAAAVRSVAGLGASLLTVHAGGGPVMLAEAQEAAQAIVGAPALLAVTVLTSMDRAQLAATGVQGSPAEQTVKLGLMAHAAGIYGLVCSPLECALLRDRVSLKLQLVVPGIRPAGVAGGDQIRVQTPAAALAAGASMLVVGRPITSAADPAAAAEAILAEMDTELVKLQQLSGVGH